MKCKDCDNYNLCKYYHKRRENSQICKEFDNNWGMIEKLEKIKTELSSLLESSAWQYDVRKIINNHISKLKGEQE